MKPNEAQRESIDRLRRDAYSRDGREYTDAGRIHKRTDEQIAIRLCLLTYPSDSEEPVTNEWLREEWGFARVWAGTDQQCGNPLWIEKEIPNDNGPTLVRWFQEINSVQIGTSNGIRGPWTRGRFRALMCALGAESRL